MRGIKYISLLAFSIVSLNVLAQCDTVSTLCNKHLPASYISDGQNYTALLLGEEVAEFHTTFFGGTTYRLAACSGLSDGNLIFRLFDQERNLLFSNEEYRNAPYWDFATKSTIDCIIETQLDPTTAPSGCSVLLIGFQQ